MAQPFGRKRRGYSGEFRNKESGKKLVLLRTWSGTRSSAAPARLGSPIWLPTIFAAPVPGSAMIAAENSNRFGFCWARFCPDNGAIHWVQTEAPERG